MWDCRRVPHQARRILRLHPSSRCPPHARDRCRRSLSTDSWAQKGSFTDHRCPVVIEPSLDGCNRLPFEPSISVAPDGQAGSTPTGLTVGMHVPQDSRLEPEGLPQANVKDTSVALPAGVALNPAAADGLEACSEAQIGLSSDSAASCPEASKVGTVEIKTPLLPNALIGCCVFGGAGREPVRVVGSDVYGRRRPGIRRACQARRGSQTRPCHRTAGLDVR